MAYSGKIDHRVPPYLPLSLFHQWLHLEVMSKFPVSFAVHDLSFLALASQNLVQLIGQHVSYKDPGLRARGVDNQVKREGGEMKTEPYSLLLSFFL